MKRTLSLFLSLLIAFGIFSGIPFTENAFDFLKIEAKAASTERDGDLVLTLNDDGQSYSVTDFMSSITESVEIPSTYKGLRVTEIGERAFAYSSCLSSITIPSTITSVGDAAFYECDSLEKVNITDVAAWCSIEFGSWYSNPFSKADLYLNGELVTDLIIPEGVEYINSYAFQYLDSVASVKIPDSVIGIGACAFSYCESLSTIKMTDSVKTIGEDAFYNTAYYNEESNWENNILYLNTILLDAKDEALGDVIIKDGTTSVSANAFEYSDTLTSVTIPNSVTSIGDNVFCYCRNLKTVTIGSGLTNFNVNVFDSCVNLREVIVSENNPAYSSENGLLLSKDKSTLIKYPSDKEDVIFTIPEYISTIATNAIDYPSNLRLLIGCDNVNSFDEGSVVVIGAVALSSKSFTSFALNGNEAAKIYYNGSAEDFKNNFGEIFDELTYSERDTYEIVYGLPLSTGETDDFYYLVTPENEIEIVGYKQKMHNLAVPSEIAGKPVTSIGAGAFCDDDVIFNNQYFAFIEDSLFTVTLPETVEHISAYGFAGCPALRYVDLPNSLVSVGAFAFYLCADLSVQLPYGTSSIGYMSFYGNKFVGLSETIENIGIYSVFSNYISIPAGVSGYSEGSILSISECCELYFGGTEEELNTLTENQFISFEAEQYNVSYNLPKSLYDNGEFTYFVDSNDNVEIVGYNRAKTDVVIPEAIDGLTVATIGNNAFCGSNIINDTFYFPLLNSVSIPDTVEKISAFAFCGCYGIGELIVPDSVKYLGSYSLLIPFGNIKIGSGVEYFGEEAISTEMSLVLSSSATGFTENSVWCACLYYNGTEEQLNSLVDDGYVNYLEYELCSFDKFDKTDEFAYFINNDNEIEIVRYLGEESIIFIPEEINGLPVTTLGYNVFLRVVYNPEYGDFELFNGYEEITVPDSVTSLSDYSFNGIYETGVVIKANCYSYAAEYLKDVDDFTPIHNVSSDWQIVSEPTCTEEGFKNRGCTNCVEGENQAIPALGHNYTEGWSVDIKPTCTEYGSKSRTCMRCGHKGHITALDALGHNFVDGICTLCENTVGMEWLAFELNADNQSYSVIDCAPEASGDIFIPATYNGLPVTVIGNIPNTGMSSGYGSGAFMNCADITSITIPDSVTTIKSNAFAYCTSLKTVFLGTGIKEFQYPAFNGISHVVTFVYDGTYESWANVNKNGLSWLNYEVYYQITPENSVDFLQFSYTGDEYYVYSCDSSAYGDIVIPSTYNGLPVTGINSNAFNDCDYITSITIPDTITNIGENAFPSRSDNPFDLYITDLEAWCSIKFSSYYTPLEDVGNFYLNNELITDLVVPDTVTIINPNAFGCYDKLTSLVIPDSVTAIGYYAFYGCTNLNSITFSNAVLDIGYGAFFNTAYVSDESNWEDGICYIDNVLCFADYEVVSGEVIVRPGTRSISYMAFSECVNLTSIVIPDSVMNIGPYAFENCRGLTTIEIPDSVTRIGEYAFNYCNNITTITVPNSVKSLGDHAFSNCTSLTSITLSDNITNIGAGTFFNCNNLTSITIPDGVTSIGGGAFEDCTNLASITIPDSVTSIGDSAFWYCYSLTEITIPDSVTSIGADAFDFCSGVVIVANCDSYAAEYALNEYIGLSPIHDFSTEWTIEYEPTCKNDGLKTHHCLKCDSYGDETDIPAFGHSFSEWQVVTAPTCIEAGVEYRICATCSQEETRAVSAHGHVYPEKGNVISQPTFTEPGLQIKVCENCREHAVYEEIPALEAPVLKQLNGQWVYASGDTIITDYTGLVPYSGGWFYVANGVLDWGYTGLTYYGDSWYYVANGALDWNYTGLAAYGGNFFHISNGVLDWSYTGLSYYYGGFYYVTNGVIDWSYTGLTEYCGGYYHVQGGYLDWSYSGLSYYYGDWYYVTNGCIDWNYTGLTNYYGTWYYVVGGYLDWSVTTLTFYGDTWYYVENGAINWNSDTLCYYGDTWYYVKGGTIAWNYTGYVNYYGVNYYITNGYLDWSKQ